MRLYEGIASALIGSPLQRPAESLRWVLQLPQQIRHPELREIYLEGGRIRALIRRKVTDGMNCVDIGSHLGSVLQQMVQCSPRGRHIAIEPLSYKAAWLRRKYPGVEVHEVALSDAARTAEFYFNPRSSGFSGLKPHEATGPLEKLAVRCTTLDDLVPADRTIGLIKIDVEGAEYHVLRGAMRIIRRDRPTILFECTQSGLAGYDLSAEGFFGLFNDELGYHIFLIRDWLAGGAPLGLQEFKAAMKYPFQAFNFVGRRAYDPAARGPSPVPT